MTSAMSWWQGRRAGAGCSPTWAIWIACMLGVSGVLVGQGTPPAAPQPKTVTVNGETVQAVKSREIHETLQARQIQASALENARRAAQPFEKPIPFKKESSVEWSAGQAPSHIVVYRTVDKAGNLAVCTSLPIGTGTSLLLSPSTWTCSDEKDLTSGGLVELQLGDEEYAYLLVGESRVWPFAGSDMGIALTLVDRWKDPKKEAFKSHGGASTYVALSKLKSRHFRAIAHLALLDFDPDQDFEVGLGTGLMYKPTPSTDSGAGFSIALGVGYNLMVEDQPSRWYTFLGLGYNLDQLKKEAPASAK